MSKIRIGVDVGQNGAYSIFINDELKKYGKIPQVADELNMAKLFDEFNLFVVSELDSYNIHVALEDLHSIFGTSAKSNFQFGVNNGLIVGCIKLI